MKKIRKYHYEDKFGVDQFSMRIFVAIKRKLERDYLPFISSLQKMYKRGDVKDQLNTFNNDVVDMLSIVSAAIEDNDLSDASAKDLVIVAESVENGKVWFESQVATNKAFRGKLQKVEVESGVAPKHLTITKQIAAQGSSQALKQTKEGFIPWANRVAPKTMESLKTAGAGAATGLLGPFAGVVGMFSDAGKLASQAGRKYTRSRETKAAATVRAKMPPRIPGFGSSAGGGVPFAMPSPVRPGFRGQGKMVDTPIWKFFNKGAYQAKWTKELLSVLKQTKRVSGGAGGGGGIGGMVGTAAGAAGVTSIAKKLLPALKKGGAALGVAGATAFAGYEAWQLKKADSDLRKANRRAADALDSLAAFGEKEIERIKRAGGLEAYAKKAGETPRQVAMGIASREQFTAQKRWETRSPWKKVWGVSSFFKKPKVEPYYDRVADLESQLSTTKAMNLRSQDSLSNVEMVSELKKISANTKPTAPAVLGSGSQRNIHDSGDVLINQFLLQGLTIGD